jgi:hypothetical protein
MLNKPLDAGIVERLNAVDEKECVGLLEEVGIEPEAIVGFRARLAEARAGTITTQSWLASWIPA